MLAVAAFALKAVGQARKNHGHIGVLGGGHRPQELLLIALVAVGGEALHIGHAAVVHNSSVHRADRRGVHVAGTAALVARPVGIRADVNHLLPLAQRQRAQIAQQHAALLGQLGGKAVVCGAVKHSGLAG